jgi:hypothetical protein
VAASNYKETLFKLLPQLYQTYDEGDGSLRAFLAALGETLDDMEKNIAGLHDDSFIESCHTWVIPYIGRLIGARLLTDEGVSARQEVMKTIAWRKRKGTLSALEDLAREITGWGVQAAEFFEQTGWSQNLNHIKLDHLQSPDLRDHSALFSLGSASNTLLHNVDIRTPGSQRGWFQIRNTGFFLSTAALNHYRRVPLQRVSGQPCQFRVEPGRHLINLFDGVSRFPLAQILDPKERLAGFGDGQTVDVYSQGILVAAPTLPVWKGSPAIAPTDKSILNPKDGEGMCPMDWHVKDGEPLKYTLTPMALYEDGGKARLEPLGYLDLDAQPLVFHQTADGSAKPNPRLVMQIKPKSGYDRSFPAMVLRLMSAQTLYDVFPGVEDRRNNIYKDRLYVYLPSVGNGAETCYVIDRYGSSYLYQHDPAQPQPADEQLFDFTRLARVSEGVVYPSRKLSTAGMPAQPVYSLARRRALKAVDRGQFISALVPASGFTINAWNRDNQPGGGVLRLLASIRITSPADKPIVTTLANQTCESPGHLIISLHRSTPKRIPALELIVTGERGKAILVYLPQVDDMEPEGAFFYVAEDGATYRVNAKPIDGGLLVPRQPDAGIEGGFNPVLLARTSAGQCLPIQKRTPVQQRMAVRCDLSQNSKPRSGLLVVDPVIGQIAFAEKERPRMPLTVSYHHGLQAQTGAGSYFHDQTTVDEGRMLRVSKQSAPDGYWHLRPPSGGVTARVRIHATIQAAVQEAVIQGALQTGETGPLVIEIEDSGIYDEDIDIAAAVPCGLIIRAAQFQYPVLNGRIHWNGPADQFTSLAAFQGLVLNGTLRFNSGRFGEIRVEDCTLLNRLLLLKAVKAEEDRYPQVRIANSILRGRISLHGDCLLNIQDSALDPEKGMALVARHAVVAIERCTVRSNVQVKELEASESIFMKAVHVCDPQQGCVRYCRIPDTGNVLPRAYRCTTEAVTFMQDQPWHSAYLKIKRNCAAEAARWAENGGEIGLYHRAGYTLKQKNLNLKFEEYLPAGLCPVLIDQGDE